MKLKRSILTGSAALLLQIGAAANVQAAVAECLADTGYAFVGTNFSYANVVGVQSSAFGLMPANLGGKERIVSCAPIAGDADRSVIGRGSAAMFVQGGIGVISGLGALALEGPGNDASASTDVKYHIKFRVEDSVNANSYVTIFSQFDFGPVGLDAPGPATVSNVARAGISVTRTTGSSIPGVGGSFGHYVNAPSSGRTETAQGTLTVRKNTDVTLEVSLNAASSTYPSTNMTQVG